MARKDLLVADSPEDLTDSMGSWLWLKTSTGEIFELSGGSWVLKTGFSLTNHAHATHGDINFTGTVSTDGEAGLTGSKVLDGKRLTFKNGLLVGYELA